MVNDPVLRTRKVLFVLISARSCVGFLFLNVSWLFFMQPLSVELGPGILGNIFDGIQVHKCNKHIVVLTRVHLSDDMASYHPFAAPSKNNCN